MYLSSNNNSDRKKEGKNISIYDICSNSDTESVKNNLPIKKLSIKKLSMKKLSKDIDKLNQRLAQLEKKNSFLNSLYSNNPYCYPGQILYNPMIYPSIPINNGQIIQAPIPTNNMFGQAAYKKIKTDVSSENNKTKGCKETLIYIMKNFERYADNQGILGDIYSMIDFNFIKNNEETTNFPMYIIYEENKQYIEKVLNIKILKVTIPEDIEWLINGLKILVNLAKSVYKINSKFKSIPLSSASISNHTFPNLSYKGLLDSNHTETYSNHKETYEKLIEYLNKLTGKDMDVYLDEKIYFPDFFDKNGIIPTLLQSKEICNLQDGYSIINIIMFLLYTISGGLALSKKEIIRLSNFFLDVPDTLPIVVKEEVS
jgi:hypothetical protein